ncbi:transposon Tf2-9 polyprotein [Trichonephila clavipes]|nr:transposon Tf2-9 polyprotein [Trichonephila clavipes]
MEQQIADLLRQNQDLIRALQIRDDSHSHKVTVQFDKFDEENENFDSFIERFETYLDVQNVPIANRAKVFVSSLSAKLYQLLKNLLAPDIPSDQTLDKLKDALKKHLTPKPLIIPSRHKFLNRKQTEGEGFEQYPLLSKVELKTKLTDLKKEGIIEKVDSSEWATPVVPVVKSDGSIRLCADYSVTLNPNLIVPQHPLPRLDEIFGSLNGGKQFTKLDFKHAYLQMKVHPDTSDASPVGIGCVLSHVYPDGSERPIAFASRTLSGSEKNTPKLIRKLFQ